MTDWLALGGDPGDEFSDHWETVPEPPPFGPPKWRERAACLNLWDEMQDPATARPVCEGCPVQKECLAFALDTEPDDTVVWAGTTFDQRSTICPICQRAKAPASLGCGMAHNLLRIARLLQVEAEGDPDVRVSMRTEPTYRTDPACPLPRGANHGSRGSYRMGCRCAASIAARTEEERERTGVTNPRGPYKRRTA